MNRNSPEETAAVWSAQDHVPVGAGKAQFWSFKEAESPEAEQMPHRLTGNPFLLQPNYVNSETGTLFHQALVHPTSANSSQDHPKGIPPRWEADLCKGHCVNHHTPSLAAAVANCLWRSRNKILVNPPPNITKIQHHHHPPHKWPWATSTLQLMDELCLSWERCSTGG